MKHWAFDLDGTLVDSFAHYFAALEAIFAEHGARFEEKLRYPALTEPVLEFFEQHLGRAALPQALVALQERSNADAARIRPFEGLVPVLRLLAGNGARIAVCTNRDLTSARLILEQTGLDRAIELCVSGTCVTRRKPHPEGLLRIAGHFGCDPAELFVVGDHEHDVEAAKSIGATAVRASWHSYWPVERCPRSDAQFYRIEALAGWIRASSGPPWTEQPSTLTPQA